MRVKRSAYRQPVSAGALKGIEEGTLRWFDPDAYASLNSGVLEQYLDELNREHSFTRSRFVWWKVLLGISIGLVFTVITQYIGLKIGLVTGGAWYVTYLVGMALKWDPTEINITSGAATATDRTVTGFVFTFPAIYLLAMSPRYMLSDGSHLISAQQLEGILPLAMVSSIIASLLGLMYFIIFRRLWLVEDPLPAPGFQAFIKLTEIAGDISSGAIHRARRSIRLVLLSFSSWLFFSFLKEFPVGGKPPLDHLFGGSIYSHGTLRMPYSASTYTHVAYEFTGIGFAIGWFMKFRTAFLVAFGSFVTWFFMVPLAVYLNVPLYVPMLDNPARGMNGMVSPRSFPITYMEGGELRYLLGAQSPAIAAATGLVKIVAIGAILGGGVTALLKMLPTFRRVFSDIRSTRGEEKREWVRGKGWYEWPTQHITIMVSLATVFIFSVFVISGYPVLASLLYALLLVTLTFVLGAIAVKVSGEVGTTPVSGTSFITLIILFISFLVVDRITPFPGGKSQILLMSLVGTTVFGSAISLSSEIMWDFKVGLYVGTRPLHLVKAESISIVVGTISAALAAVFFSTLLARGELDLQAPQAHAFAVFAQILAGGKVMASVFVMGIIIGVMMELLTGMGTAFGLGMYLPLQYTLMLVTGGAARDIWERRRLERRAEELGWGEREKTFALLDTYMLATGLYIAEAVMGIVLAVYLVTGS